MARPLHRKLRTQLAAQINRRELAPGDWLLAERDLAEEFGVARSVVRQALAGLARDGLIVSVYPRGYRVRGPRIPWLPRLRPLVSEPWALEVIDVVHTAAGARDAADLRLDMGDPVVVRLFDLRGARSGEAWATALSTVPLDAFADDAHPSLLHPEFVADADLERISGHRIVGYSERVSARLATDSELEPLDLDASAPVLVVTRIARTTITPLSKLELVARPDRLEVDYLIDA